MFVREFLQRSNCVLTQVFCCQGLAFEKIFVKTVEMDAKELSKSLAAIAEQLLMLARAIGSEATNPLVVINNPAQVADLVARGLCLHCKKPIAEGQKKVRGLHESCRKAVGDVYPIDLEAVAAGVLLPESKGGRQPAREKIELMAKKREAEEKANEWKQKKTEHIQSKKKG